MTAENVRFFDSFGAEYIPEEIGKFVGKNIITNISKIQAFNSTKCE